MVVASALPSLAQVDKVAMRTTGISCGLCAGLSEVSFKRLPGVDQVKISLANEAIMLTYKPDSTFDPAVLRDLLKRLQVGVTQFQISARGRAHEESGKQVFVAGKEKFVVTITVNTPEIPPDKPVSIEAILNDKVSPMEIKVLTVRPINQ
jgi:copper chaperone CopZ